MDRNKDSNWTTKELINEKGKIDISPDEKLKVSALKAVSDNDSVTFANGKYTFNVGENSKNQVLNDAEIEKSVNRAIHFLEIEILYSGQTVTSTMTTLMADYTPEDKFIPYGKMYQDFRTPAEVSANTVLDVEVLKTRKKAYFKSKIKEKLYLNETAIETKLYEQLKDVL